MALLFPVVHDDIDWSRGHELLPNELRKLIRQDEIGERKADLLVKVWRTNGGERWLLIHLEVQGGHETAFPRRMFVYHYRLFNRYNREICSLAILADDRPHWRPNSFGYDVWGCRLQFEFPIVKLLDWLPRLPELEADPNPFAAIVAAHLLAQQTRHDAAGRRANKMRLVRGLYERGLNRRDIEELFRLIDWLMALPPPEDVRFWEELNRYEQEKQMPYITSVERIGMERGRAEGRAEGVVRGQAEMLLYAAEKHFGQALPEELTARIRQTTEVAQLKQWFDLLSTVSSLDDFQQRMQG